MRGRWMWGGYAVSVAWVGLLFIHMDRFLHVSRTEAFRREGRRLIRLWADRIADAVGPQQANALVRRFSGELDSRSVALLNDEGQSLQWVGDTPPAPPRLPLSDPSDRSLDASSWAYWTPLWASGRRHGYVVWVRDASSLHRDRAHTRRGLLTAWAWWAAAGAIAAAYAARSKP